MVKLRIRKLLRARKMSVYRLARLLRVPQTTAYRVAHGAVKRLDLRLADKLCAVLDCQVADLFERVPSRPHTRRHKPKGRGGTP